MAEPSKKQFKLRADEFRPLAEGRGSCYATDKITVAGQRVGFMYREQAFYAQDTGWRFFSGTETQEYVDDARNTMIYDVNTIANYDPDIIPFLDAPPGSAFERKNGTGPFVEVHGFEPPAG